MEKIILKAPLQEKQVLELKAGDEVLIEGTIYAARDAAHQKMVAAIKAGEQLAFDIKGQIIYYVGPCPAKPGEIIGAAGPTTSVRMDANTPLLLECGLKAMIGKGERSEVVVDAIKENRAIYLATIGGAGAYLSKCVKSMEVIAYHELGPEALMKLEVKDFPCIVAIDAKGNDLYLQIRQEKKA